MNAAVIVLSGTGPGLNLGAGLAQSIFDGGRLRAVRDETRARDQELLVAYRAAILASLVDVENSLTGLQGLDAQRQFQEAALAQSEQAFAGAQLRYRQGAGDYLTVLEAQRNLYAVRDQYSQYRLARLQARVALCKALGGGWTRGVTPMVTVTGTRVPCRALPCVALVVLLLAITGCHRAPEAAQAADASQPAAGAADGITLPAEQVRKLGIATTPATATDYTPKTLGYGTVLPHDTFATAVADLTTAQAAQQRAGSRSRLQRLSGTPGALSADAGEAAARQAATDSAAVTLAQRRLSVLIGGGPGTGLDSVGPLLQDLASGRVKLLAPPSRSEHSTARSPQGCGPPTSTAPPAGPSIPCGVRPPTRASRGAASSRRCVTAMRGRGAAAGVGARRRSCAARRDHPRSRGDPQRRQVLVLRGAEARHVRAPRSHDGPATGRRLLRRRRHRRGRPGRDRGRRPAAGAGNEP